MSIKKYIGAALIAFFTLGPVGLFAQTDTVSSEPEEAYDPSVLLSVMADESTDYYQTFIDAIFGGGTITAPQESLASKLSAILNIGVLIFVGAIALYKGVMWGAHTATSGVWGGQKVSVFWGTLSLSLAVSMSIPIANGYSPAQYFITKLAKTGGELANVMANAGAVWLDSEGGIASTDVRYTDPMIFQTLIGETCMASANQDLFNSSNPSPTNRDFRVRRTTICKTLDGDLQYDVNSCPSGRAFTVAWDIATSNPQQTMQVEDGAYDGFCGSITLTNTVPNNEDVIAQEGLLARIGSAMTSYNQETLDINNRKFDEDVSSLLTMTGAIASLADSGSGLFQVPNNSNLSILQGHVDFAKAKLDQAESALASAPPDSLQAAREAVTENRNEYETLLAEFENMAAMLENAYATRSTEIAANAGAIRTIQQQFERSLSSTAASLVSEFQTVRHNETNQTWRDELERKGFVVLGFYYYTMIKINERVRELTRVNADLGDPSYSGYGHNWSGEMGSNNVYQNALASLEHIPAASYDNGRISGGYGELVTVTTANIPRNRNTGVEYGENSTPDTNSSRRENRRNGGIPTPEPDMNYLGMALHGLKGIFQGDTDLVIQMSTMGRVIANIGFGIIIAVGLSQLAGALGFGGAGGLAAGAIKGLFGNILGVVNGWIAGIIVSVAAACLALGAFMAVWIPLIVPLEFAMGVLGLMIIYVTCLMLIPIWLATLAFATTSDAWEGGHYRQGFVMLVGLAVRPALMVMVFFMLFVLLQIAGIIMQLFVDLSIGMLSSNSLGGKIFGFILLLPTIAALAIIAWQMISRIFSLTTDMPDKIMQGLNLGHDNFGTLEDSDRAKGVFVGWNQSTKGIAGGFMAGGKK